MDFCNVKHLPYILDKDSYENVNFDAEDECWVQFMDEYIYSIIYYYVLV